MMKTTKSAIFAIFTALAFAAALATPSAWATVGEDDRFYVRNSKWTNLFNGVVFITNEEFDEYGGCSGFLLEGDIIVTAGHCLSGDDLNSVKEDGSIDFKKVKNLRVYFGDARFIFFRQKTAFNERSKPYTAKDIFVGANLNDRNKGAISHDFFKDDFAFIKLNEPIPKKYKRFKLLKDIDLHQYKILDEKFQKGLNVSTVGYPGDVIGTERLAHVGCRIRASKQYKGTWSFFTDCDVEKGQSGSPMFRILEHKRTREVELAVLGIFTSVFGYFGTERDYDYNNEDLKYLAGRSQYHVYTADLERESGQYSVALSLNNHLFFNEILEGFKKDSSRWRNRKIPALKKYNYLNRDYLKTKINSYNAKELNKFLTLLENHNLLRYRGGEGSVIALLSSITRRLDNLPYNKEKVINNFVERIKDRAITEAKILLNKRRKRLSYENLHKVYGVSLLKENGKPKEYDELEFPLENPRKDKRLSDKWWIYYFGQY